MNKFEIIGGAIALVVGIIFMISLAYFIADITGISADKKEIVEFFETHEMRITEYEDGRATTTFQKIK